MFRKNNGRYLIKTPTGYKKFEGIQTKIVDSLLTVKLDDGSFIKCSENHQFLGAEGFKKAIDLMQHDNISGKNVLEIIVESGNFVVYDPVGVDEHSTYFSNGVISHNCEFLGSSATLIPGSKLKTLTFNYPISTEEYLQIFELPKAGHTYIAVVDCAEGVGLDYSVCSIIDVTELPYKHVAKFRDNKLSPMIFPTYVYNLVNRYNRAWVLVETNSVGQQVVDILHYDLEYENIFRIEHHEIKGQHISSGFKKGAAYGVKTSKTVKKIGCANLKTLIETDKLITNDFDAIAELNTFVRVKESYEAEEGNNDDIVMTLVLFSWLTAQSYFKEITDSDVRQRLLDERNLQMDDEMLPVGELDDGLQEQKEFDGTDLWTNMGQRGYMASSL